MSEPLWVPSQKQVEFSNLTRFRAWLQARHGVVTDSYDDLYRWSISNIEDFWASIWEFTSLIASRQYDHVVQGSKIWNTRWFDGARLNFAENLLRYRDQKTASIGYAEGK